MGGIERREACVSMCGQEETAKTLGPIKLLLLKSPSIPNVEQGHLGRCTWLMLQAEELGKQNV